MKSKRSSKTSHLMEAQISRLLGRLIQLIVRGRSSQGHLKNHMMNMPMSREVRCFIYRKLGLYVLPSMTAMRSREILLLPMEKTMLLLSDTLKTKKHGTSFLMVRKRHQGNRLLFQIPRILFSELVLR